MTRAAAATKDRGPLVVERAEDLWVDEGEEDEVVLTPDEVDGSGVGVAEAGY
jgi:hypothetical protein